MLLKDSSLLQQASNLTNGIYFKMPQTDGLLYYLLWLYLTNENMRKIFVQPPKNQVDYRAACFCHRKLIDIGYVCSVCLSVFCSFTPICSTCDSAFQFDVNVLKLGKMFDSNKQQKIHDVDNLDSSVTSKINQDLRMDTNRATSEQSSDAFNMANENLSNNLFNDCIDMLE
jgi:hypothetical protein